MTKGKPKNQKKDLRFLKVIYFDEIAAQDYIDIENGGRFDWTTEENKEKLAKIVAEIEASAGGSFNFLNYIKASFSSGIKAETDGNVSSIVGSTLKNTLLTDYISIASEDESVKMFGPCGVYAPLNSVSLYKMYSSYLNIVPKDQIPFDMEKLNEAVLGERGYYAMLLNTEQEPLNVLRFNITGFKNQYHLADMSKMNLVYLGVKVGECELKQLSIENEFTNHDANSEISAYEVINGSRNRDEKSNSKNMAVYDIVLAGVMREKN